MINQLEEILKKADKMLKDADSMQKLEEARIALLGKKGELTAILRGMGALPAEERPIVGAKANAVRAEIEKMLEAAAAELKKKELEKRLISEKIDVTIPGTPRRIGTSHPLSIIRTEIEDIFRSLGFTVAEGPEVEYAYYNFDALNTPQNHPARDLQDTFYFSENMLLRTQTSSAQARFMEKHKPPLRMICPGAVYRSDDVDATHSPFFHQIEGLMVDIGIGLADLKGVLIEFSRLFFGPNTKVRFRPTISRSRNRPRRWTYPLRLRHGLQPL